MFLLPNKTNNKQKKTDSTHILIEDSSQMQSQPNSQTIAAKYRELSTK